MNREHQGTVVGVTGTRFGMSDTQKRLFRLHLEAVDAGVLHHGDCVGVDSDAHDIARILGLWIVGHPPTAEGLRAYKDCDELWPAKPFMARNREIVLNSERLIGLPDAPQERLRSGTWATIRHAKRVKIPTLVLAPDGQTETVSW